MEEGEDDKTQGKQLHSWSEIREAIHWKNSQVADIVRRWGGGIRNFLK